MSSSKNLKDACSAVSTGVELAVGMKWLEEAETTEGRCVFSLWTRPQEHIENMKDGINLGVDTINAVADSDFIKKKPGIGIASKSSAVASRQISSYAIFSQWVLIVEWPDTKNDEDGEQVFPRSDTYEGIIYKDELIPKWTTVARDYTPVGDKWSKRDIGELPTEISPKRINIVAKQLWDREDFRSGDTVDYILFVKKLWKELCREELNI